MIVDIAASEPWPSTFPTKLYELEGEPTYAGDVDNNSHY